MSDTPRTQRKRQREKRTISQMVVIFCEGAHQREGRTERAYCGELLCPECLQIDSYAVLRTDQCRKMEIKTLCEDCENFCYEPAKRQSIREVMRYAGPRMMKRHPIAAIRHLINK